MISFLNYVKNQKVIHLGKDYFKVSCTLGKNQHICWQETNIDDIVNDDNEINLVFTIPFTDTVPHYTWSLVENESDTEKFDAMLKIAHERYCKNNPGKIITLEKGRELSIDSIAYNAWSHDKMQSDPEIKYEVGKTYHFVTSWGFSISFKILGRTKSFLEVEATPSPYWETKSRKVKLIEFVKYAGTYYHNKVSECFAIHLKEGSWKFWADGYCS